VRFLLQLTHPAAPQSAPTLSLHVDGAVVEVPDDDATLLEVLRERLGRRSPKDGCSPQGQCGCCTVWVDGAPRVACVTPVRRVAGREVTTLEGLDPAVRETWADAFTAVGASQCGFCTPGIIMRLAALGSRRADPDDDDVRRALAAHLCRCTGWQTIVDAARRVHADAHGPGPYSASAAVRVARHMDDAARRAALEGAGPQVVGANVACGGGGFAEDTAPGDALVAVADGQGGWVVGSSPADARRRAGRVPGRNSTVALRHPLEVPPGPWDLSLRTTFVEPAYLEPDASWCAPGGEPVTPLSNGGAFGGKTTSPVGAVARRLADETGRVVRVVYSREDVVRYGPKRPPIAAGLRADGSGVVRVARTPGSPPLDRWVDAVARVAPGLVVEEVDVPGPPVSADLRGAGWAEAAVLMAALAVSRAEGPGSDRPVTVRSPAGARATVTVRDAGDVVVSVAAGEPLDEVVLRSYVVGAVHQALGWVRSEGVAVDQAGTVLDLTIRSFGIIPARGMPAVEVVVEEDGRPPVAVGDTVFAAAAAAAWLAAGLPSSWPVDVGGGT
jgi:xanthine dehydrogenase small subunit